MVFVGTVSYEEGILTGPGAGIILAGVSDVVSRVLDVGSNLLS